MVRRRMHRGIILGMLLLLLSGCSGTTDISPNVVMVDVTFSVTLQHYHWQSTDGLFAHQFYTHILTLPDSQTHLCPDKVSDPTYILKFDHNNQVIAIMTWDCYGVYVVQSQGVHSQQPDAQFYAMLTKITGITYQPWPTH